MPIPTFNLIEWAHDTPGKIISYKLTIDSGQITSIIVLDIPELIELSLLIQDELESDKNRFSERFKPKTSASRGFGH